MWIAVIFGYLVSVLFAFCGVVKTIAVVQSIEKFDDYPAFLSTLSLEAWPLAVGMALFLLTQIAIQSEKAALTASKPLVVPQQKPRPAAPIAPVIAKQTEAEKQPAAAPSDKA